MDELVNPLPLRWGSNEYGVVVLDGKNFFDPPRVVHVWDHEGCHTWCGILLRPAPDQPLMMYHGNPPTIFITGYYTALKMVTCKRCIETFRAMVARGFWSGDLGWVGLGKLEHRRGGLDPMRTLREYITEPTPGGYTRHQALECPLGRVSCITPPWYRCPWLEYLFEDKVDGGWIHRIACKYREDGK